VSGSAEPPAAGGRELAVRVDGALDQAIRLLPLHGPSAVLRYRLRELRERWQNPLRVVVAGRPGTGKSTLIAAVGGDLPFDVVEASWADLPEAAPDALVLVLNGRSAADEDVDMVREFQQLGLTSAIATPMNALAVVRIEGHWSADSPPPEVRVERAIRQLMTDKGGHRLLSHIWPVATKVGAAARALRPEDLADLSRLAAEVEAWRLDDAADDVNLFGSPEEEDLPVAPASRKSLIDRFTGYGIVLACSRLREAAARGERTTEDDLRDWLLDRSGVASLRARLLRQFGDHADLIKLNGLVRHVRRMAADLLGGSAGPLTGWDEGVIRQVTALLREDSFAGDDAWERYVATQHLYLGKARFHGTDGDDEEALRLLGERGRSAADRLGLAPDTPAAVLAAEADKRHTQWSRRQNHPYTEETRQAYRAVLRACDALIDETRA
jgi:hypothetical protein